MITKIDDVYNNFSKDTCDKIELIRNEKKKKKKPEDCNVYISAVEWDSSDDDILTDVEIESESEDGG